MKLTKYEHACFSVELDGKLLIIDPGVFTTNLPALENVEAVVITHEHEDHFDVSALGAIIAHNPGAVIYAHTDIVKQLGKTLPSQAVAAGQSLSAGSFNLEFFGGEHAVIHPNIPTIANLGVMINGAIYYPGDSFTEPNKPVDVLALPTAAPWMKMSEAIDYVMRVKPRFAFPTHDAISNDAGKALADQLVTMFASSNGIEYKRLTDSIDIDG